ncbi:MAG: DUF3822 family protein [Bacteroidaceae bacterium]|nr:DUF3822 family protein [Bacteroidaceae bacterium]
MEGATSIDTSQYTLMMRMTPSELLYVYYHPAEDGSMVSERIALPVGDEYAHTIEQAVYGHEILLQPFKRVYVVMPSKHFVLVPQEVATLSDNSMFFERMYPSAQDYVIESHMPHTGAVMLSGADARVVSFINRTFDNPTLLHPLTALCEYFYRKSRLGNQRKMYVHLLRNRMDVVCYGREGLLLANPFVYRHSNDAAYHLLNVWKQLGLDQRHDEVQIAGDADTRRELSALLRNYILTVVPVIFPSHCHVLGSDAMQIPFDLTALSLCEL